MATTTASASPSPIPWWLVLIQGIAALVIGFFLLTSPAMTTAVLVTFLGLYWFISGIFGIVNIFIDKTAWGWKLFSGILGIIAGVVILQHPLWSTVLVPATLVLLLGIQGIIIGVINLVQAFQGGGWGIGILGVLSILLGFFLAFNPLAGALALPLVLGIFGVIGGIAAIIMAFRLR
jgi:uncharacterized membrane protein HdeD (DUF308 family)